MSPLFVFLSVTTKCKSLSSLNNQLILGKVKHILYNSRKTLEKRPGTLDYLKFGFNNNNGGFIFAVIGLQLIIVHWNSIIDSLKHFLLFSLRFVEEPLHAQNSSLSVPLSHSVLFCFEFGPKFRRLLQQSPGQSHPPNVNNVFPISKYVLPYISLGGWTLL